MAKAQIDLGSIREEQAAIDTQIADLMSKRTYLDQRYDEQVETTFERITDLIRSALGAGRKPKAKSAKPKSE